MINPETHPLLLVEDNPDDIFLMQRALKKTGLRLPVQIVTDGRQAIDYLSSTAPYEDRAQFPLPSLVFLDLKLPYVNGFEVLEWIRADSRLCDLPIFILTSSPEERDKEKAAQLGVMAYLVKPPTSASILEALQSIDLQEMGQAESHWANHPGSAPTPYPEQIRIY